MKDAQELVDLLAKYYGSAPDDYVVSVGHWTLLEGELIPNFYADLKLTAGELRTLASKAST